MIANTEMMRVGLLLQIAIQAQQPCTCSHCGGGVKNTEKNKKTKQKVSLASARSPCSPPLRFSFAPPCYCHENVMTGGVGDDGGL